MSTRAGTRARSSGPIPRSRTPGRCAATSSRIPTAVPTPSSARTSATAETAYSPLRQTASSTTRRASSRPSAGSAKARPEPTTTSSPSRTSTPSIREPLKAPATCSACSTTRRPRARSWPYLVTPAAQSIWVGRGGALSPNKLVVNYPDDISRRSGQLLANAKYFVFDASDNMPTAMNAEFWKEILVYVQHPTSSMPSSPTCERPSQRVRRLAAARAAPSPGARRRHPALPYRTRRGGPDRATPRPAWPALGTREAETAWTPGSSPRSRSCWWCPPCWLATSSRPNFYSVWRTGKWRERIRPWLWLTPALVLLTAFLIVPTIQTVVASFYSKNGSAVERPGQLRLVPQRAGSVLARQQRSLGRLSHDGHDRHRACRRRPRRSRASTSRSPSRSCSCRWRSVVSAPRSSGNSCTGTNFPVHLRPVWSTKS